MSTILNSRSVWVLAILALLAALISLMVAPRVADLPSLPGSKHAGEAHEGQAWDAAAIAATMSNGGCGPVEVYLCSDDTYLYTCADPTNAARMLGLRVGATQQQIITGHVAREAYWKRQASKCVHVGNGLTP